MESNLAPYQSASTGRIYLLTAEQAARFGGLVLMPEETALPSQTTVAAPAKTTRKTNSSKEGK
jgi:hypothetical protein